MVCVFIILLFCCYFFFFNQKTAYEMRISDWSSDVCSSDLEKRATKEYTNKLDISYQAGISKGRVTGLGLGFVMLVLFCSYALAFWYGGKEVLKPEDPMAAGNVLTVF